MSQVIKRRGKDNHMRCEEFLTNHLHTIFLYTRPFITTGHASATCCAGTGGLSLVPADQGGVLVVPPAHHASGTHPEPDARLAANAVTDEQIEALHREAWEHSPLGGMADDRDPDAIRHRHRLERIPRPNRIPTSVTLHLLKAIYPAQPCTYAST